MNLSHLRKLDQKSFIHKDEMVNYLFEALDDLMVDGDFKGVRSTLEKVIPGELSDTAVIVFLCLTLTHKEKFNPEREELFQRVKAHLQKTRPKDMEELLRGLR